MGGVTLEEKSHNLHFGFVFGKAAEMELFLSRATKSKVYKSGISFCFTSECKSLKDVFNLMFTAEMLIFLFYSVN